jgi:hypothetical protein
VNGSIFGPQIKADQIGSGKTLHAEFTGIYRMNRMKIKAQCFEVYKPKEGLWGYPAYPFNAFSGLSAFSAFICGQEFDFTCAEARDCDK